LNLKKRRNFGRSGNARLTRRRYFWLFQNRLVFSCYAGLAIPIARTGAGGYPSVMGDMDELASAARRSIRGPIPKRESQTGLILGVTVAVVAIGGLVALFLVKGSPSTWFSSKGEGDRLVEYESRIGHLEAVKSLQESEEREAAQGMIPATRPDREYFGPAQEAELAELRKRVAKIKADQLGN